MGRSLKITPTVTDRRDESLKMYFREVSSLSMITPAEERELTKRIKNGDEKAAQKLVEANLRFVISIAKQYQNRGIPLVDLIQYGNIGLIEATRRFDESKGFKFISYAVWWIRQSILKALFDHSKLIRLPISRSISISEVNKASERLRQIYDRDPSVYEISEEINMELNKVDSILSYNSKVLSLESSNNEDIGDLLNVIPNDDNISVDDDITNIELHKDIEYILSKLSNRESDIVRMRFGIGMHSMSYEEIAKRFGIGYERVRQILRDTLKYIKRRYKNKLKEYHE